MTLCVPHCFRSNHSSKLDRFPQYCDGETSSGLHCYAFVRCGSIQSKVVFFCFTMSMFVRQIVSRVFMTIKLPENKQIMFNPKFYPHRLKIMKNNLPIESKLSNLIIITFSIHNHDSQI